MSVSEKLMKLQEHGKPAEQTLQKYISARKLNIFLVLSLFFFPHFTNKVLYPIMYKTEVFVFHCFSHLFVLTQPFCPTFSPLLLLKS